VVAVVNEISLSVQEAVASVAEVAGELIHPDSIDLRSDAAILRLKLSLNS
jgi:hypothetical protein